MAYVHGLVWYGALRCLPIRAEPGPARPIICVLLVPLRLRTQQHRNSSQTVPNDVML
jgi:hypothetical protein